MIDTCAPPPFAPPSLALTPDYGDLEWPVCALVSVEAACILNNNCINNIKSPFIIFCLFVGEILLTHTRSHPAHVHGYST